MGCRQYTSSSHATTLESNKSATSKRCRDGTIGKRSGLKIRRPQGHVGSTPTPGTKNSNLNLAGLRYPLSVP
jgi:hypothetical protein